MKLVFRAEFFREGEFYVGIVPELDVSSFGKSLEEARASLKEAVEAFLEECEAMGTLEEVLQEAGFTHDGHIWSARSPLATEILSVG
ncbi:type II toxin-antitoxin system HicB family antitoxin [Methanothrix sp.]|uniref:type II toxin-antitoxin system HicB family antitoxin n=1 Tax=Methanothrix sp. TaxID=90426 RepID=UPI0034E1E66E